MGTRQSIHPIAESGVSDGDQLGRVADVRGNGFRDDVLMTPDYWFPVAYFGAGCVDRSVDAWWWCAVGRRAGLGSRLGALERTMSFGHTGPLTLLASTRMDCSCQVSATGCRGR